MRVGVITRVVKQKFAIILKGKERRCLFAIQGEKTQAQVAGIKHRPRHGTKETTHLWGHKVGFIFPAGALQGDKVIDFGFQAVRLVDHIETDLSLTFGAALFAANFVALLLVHLFL